MAASGSYRDAKAAGQGPESGSETAGSRPAALMLGALGVVYGDIGTSPIYALREALIASSGKLPATPERLYRLITAAKEKK